jgi:uncharacterized protein YodC (DUF2158 family)
MHKYRIGDIVHLKSGSPKMTVTRVDGDFINVAWVSWESGKENTATYHHTCVESREDIEEKQRRCKARFNKRRRTREIEFDEDWPDNADVPYQWGLGMDSDNMDRF